MKFGVSILAGVLVATLVFILYNDSRMLTTFTVFVATAFSVLGLQVIAENQKLKQKENRGRRNVT